ncbi:MAG: ribonuclease R [Dysgonamonadaceae bacterium]|jgi:ribonuclease R|nr:ribonuclease R [Dysgonamonadaceae bacterium]
MSKKKERNPKKRMKKQELLNRIVSLFNKNPQEALNYKQVSAEVDATSHVDKLMVAEILTLLTEDDFLTEAGHGKYRLNGLGSIAEGTFQRKSNGKNWFLSDATGTSPIFVAERNSAHAMNGDRVRVQLLAKRRGRDPEAEVLEVLERGQHVFVGVIETSGHFAFLITDSKLLANDIFIPKNKLKGAKSGQKVVVRVLEWPERAKNPLGEVVDILGEAGANTTEMHAILAEYGLPYKYPESVEKAAEKIEDDVPAEEVKRREDFRGVPTFTIDPKDAKDFDDALSIARKANGNWEIGVHIADVTHYVQPGNVIDREAERRATSVYLVDRTIPMLPERLSNGLCSLRPDEDKLCFSVVFEMTDHAEVKNYRVVRTVIRSIRRFTYEEAQGVIETGAGDLHEELSTLDRLAKLLRKKRFVHGAINFDRFEVKFELDEQGKPIGVYFKESKDANKLIEEFMLLANRAAAELIGKAPKGKTAKTFVYRIHDLPDPERLDNFATFIRRFGYKLKTNGTKTDVSKGINQLLDDVQGRREQNLIEAVAVRSMAKAVYSTHNIGHYGLAFDYYTHFTSPIRRYPDMMVHRLLEKYLSGGRSVSEAKYEDVCKHCSDMEQVAAGAERASIKYKQVEFMSERLGMVFDGVISGVTEWGLYVEINDNKCEGMVPIRDLDDDFYEFDEKSYCLTGRRTKRQYRLGDPITIKVVRANLEKKQLDFALID